MKKFKLSDFENCELKKNELDEAKGGLVSCFDSLGTPPRNAGGLTGMWDPDPFPRWPIPIGDIIWSDKF